MGPGAGCGRQGPVAERAGGQLTVGAQAKAPMAGPALPCPVMPASPVCTLLLPWTGVQPQCPKGSRWQPAVCCCGSNGLKLQTHALALLWRPHLATNVPVTFDWFMKKTLL